MAEYESTLVDELPECDICKYHHNEPGEPAVVDGKTKLGPWANMCDDHNSQLGIGLGLGRGQRLILRSALTHKLRRVKPNNAAGDGPWVALACDVCRTAPQARTRQDAEKLHHEIASDPERLERLRIKDARFWREHYRS